MVDKVADSFNKDKSLPSKPSFEEIKNAVAISGWLMSKSSGHIDQEFELTEETLLSVSDPYMNKYNVPTVDLKIDFEHYIPDGMYSYTNIPPKNARVTGGYVKNTQDVSIYYDYNSKTWKQNRYNIWYTADKPSDENPTPEKPTAPAIPQFKEIEVIDVKEAIIDTNNLENSSEFKLIEGAYTISEPKLIMPKARTAQGTWVAVLSIENHLKSYTDQEVDKDKSILETTLAYDPDSESWIWDGPSLSIVTIAASETSTTPENPDIPKTENLDGKDTGNKDTSDKATGNAGTSSSGSEQRSDKKRIRQQFLE